MAKNEWLALNRALYLPAISKAYLRVIPGGQWKAPLPVTPAELDFLDPKAPFHYPFALYSAGQTDPKNLNVPQPDMVMSRDRSATVVLGDSGGFQLQTGAIEFDAVNTAPRMLNWMEHVSDYSMALDLPTGGIGLPGLRNHVKRLNGYGIDLSAIARANGVGESYMACLIQLCINNNRFVRERRPGATNFLNVLQGRNHGESRQWYEAVKHYPFEGWAFAGAHQSTPSMIVARMLDMHRDGILGKVRWLHILGTSKLEMGCVLTAIQQEVRKLGYPEFQISFDASSPSMAAVYGTVNIGHASSAHGWAMQTMKFSDLVQRFAGRPEPLAVLLREVMEDKSRSNIRRRIAASTHISRNLTIADLDPSGGSLIAHDTYDLIMHHNTQALIQAHRNVQDGFWEDRDGYDNNDRKPASVLVKVEGVRGLFADPNGAALARTWGKEFLDVWPAIAGMSEPDEPELSEDLEQFIAANPI
ncbi:hypothetical protein U1701_00035 [Sphingomonas sp. PB2P19]|uniref:hypothetical protein n=1 Tax=Sphingomonas rhamnosi TaxID=3096156 RepID=UPI002FC99103